MSSHGHHSTAAGSEESSPSREAGHPDRASDFERPLAEVRKNVNQALRVFYLHRWAFFVPCCLVSTIVFVASLSYPRTYTATTSFERRDDPIILNLQPTEGTGSWKYWRATMARDLKSVKILAEAVDSIGLTKDLPRDAEGVLTEEGVKQREAIARSMVPSLEIFTQMPSDHIDHATINYTGSDPELGRRLVDAVKKAYIRQAMGWIQAFLKEQYEYFSHARDEAFKEMTAAQRKKTELQMRNPRVDPAHPSTIVYELAQREVERRSLKLRRREYESGLAAEREMIAAREPLPAPAPATVTPNQGDAVTARAADYVSLQAKRLQDEIHALNSEIASLRKSRAMTDEHPEIVDLRKRLDGLVQEMGNQHQIDRNTVTTNTPLDSAPVGEVSRAIEYDPEEVLSRAERARAEVRIKAIENKIAEINLDLQANEAILTQLREAKTNLYALQEDHTAIKEEVSAAGELFKKHSSTLQSLEPSMAAIAQGKLLSFFDEQPTRGGATPVSPKTTTIFLLALIAGIGSGVVLVILAELFDHIYRSSSQVSRTLGLPILETIDEIVTSVDRRRRLLRRVVVTPLVLVVCLGLTSASGSLAYISIKRPWAYQRIRSIPERAISYFADTTTVPQSPPKRSPGPLPEPTPVDHDG